MNNLTRHVLIFSQDALFSAACAKELETGVGTVRVETSISPEEAHDLAAIVPPDIIVFDETALPHLPNGVAEEAEIFEAAATRLASLAPLIVVGAPERQSQVAPLLAAGAADFVARAGNFLPVACSFIERRLRVLNNQETAGPPAPPTREPQGLSELEEDFGEVLRHELNNPLTGILGNAELLLAEVRRRNDGRLPQGALRRLETITDLAVRLRETVRRLSQEWGARHDHARPA